MITLSNLDGIRRAALVERLLKKADTMLGPMYGTLVEDATQAELNATDVAARLVTMAVRAANDRDTGIYLRRQ